MTVQKEASKLRDIILGGQDGLVNVLGVILGVSAATPDMRIIIVSGLAATFAESISMAAVAYTSTEATLSEYYKSRKNEEDLVDRDPESQKEDVRVVLRKWGFENELLEETVDKITQDKARWVKFMMHEELGLSKHSIENPVWSAIVVGLSSFGGSVIPLIPFFLVNQAAPASYISIAVSAVSLFVVGFVKAKQTIGSPLNSGVKIMVIGMLSAFCGYLIGKILGSASF
jgi:predicted membrane protein (TIGR00267 family)